MRQESVLIAELDPSLRRVLKTSLERRGLLVDAVGNGKTAVAALGSQEYAMALIDLNMPQGSAFEVLKFLQQQGRGPLLMVMVSTDMVADAVEAMRYGAFDYLTKPFYLEEFEMMIDKALQMKHLEEEVVALRNSVYQKPAASAAIVGTSPVIRRLLHQIERASRSDHAVLLMGELGVGKELAARSIHLNSPRAAHPFIPVDLANIPPKILEGEIFGYTRGAFTGASRHHSGYLEQASGGTIFFNEVTDLPLSVQAKLEDVLKTGEVQRLGEKKRRKVDLRFMSSSRYDLKERVEKQNFRKELAILLGQIELSVPSLREHREDIPKLIAHFMEKFHRELDVVQKVFSNEALLLLQDHGWPGNVQELENVVKRAMVLSPGRTIPPDVIEPFTGGMLLRDQIDDMALEEMIRNKLTSFLRRWAGEDLSGVYGSVLQCMEKPLIELILDRTSGNQIRAAQILGLNRNTLRKKIIELKIIPKTRSL